MMLIPRRNYGLNLFDDFFNDPFFTSASEKGEDAKKLPVMRTDIMEKDGNYILEIELPGFKKEDIRAAVKIHTVLFQNLCREQKTTVMHGHINMIRIKPQNC